MKSENHLSVGLDIGGTNIKAVVLEWPEKIYKQFQVPSEAKKGPDAVRAAIRTCTQLLEGIPFKHVGIGCAGSVDHNNGIVRNSPNFANWTDVPLRKWIEDDLQLPVELDNDANCAVLAEWKLGAARGHANVVLLTLGTGIGGGLVLDNRIFRGSTGAAGELGHMSIHADGKSCPCGNRGCFERYCSASALVEKASGYSAKEIIQRANEEPFKEIVQCFIEELKVGLTSLANVFDPDVIVLGGAVSLGVPTYLAELQGWIKQHAFPSIGKNVRVVTSTFGHQSGALGAALLSHEN
ncbi:MAG: ROK family protein [Deltaproteobacteria bacterium]|nr:ROK family protein [Deltaproteobacteria bacterium]